MVIYVKYSGFYVVRAPKGFRIYRGSIKALSKPGSIRVVRFIVSMKVQHEGFVKALTGGL